LNISREFWVRVGSDDALRLIAAHGDPGERSVRGLAGGGTGAVVAAGTADLQTFRRAASAWRRRAPACGLGDRFDRSSFQPP